MLIMIMCMLIVTMAMLIMTMAIGMPYRANDDHEDDALMHDRLLLIEKLQLDNSTSSESCSLRSKVLKIPSWAT